MGGIGHGWYRLKTTEQFDVTLFAVHRADQPVAGQTPGQLRYNRCPNSLAFQPNFVEPRQGECLIGGIGSPFV